jgi:hypothetical protein
MPFLQMVKFHLKAISQDDQVNPGKTSLTLVPLTPKSTATPVPTPAVGRSTLQGVNGVVSRIGGAQNGRLGAYPGFTPGQAIPFLVNTADAAGLSVGMEFSLVAIVPPTPAPSAN